MKFSKLAGLFTLSILAFSACSEKSESTASASNSEPADVEIAVGSCQTIDDPELSEQINEATGSLVQFVYSATEPDSENVSNMQARAAAAKTTFQNALSKYPNSCDAQLGLALSAVANIVNNTELDTIYRVFGFGSADQQFSLLNIQSDDYSSTAINAVFLAKSNAENALITDRVQNIIANSALPAVDSAILLIQNVMKTQDYTFSATFDDNSISLGFGELSLSVGALRSIKALLTVLASYNLDASSHNSYAWALTSSNWIINYSISELTAEKKAAIDHAISLFDKNSAFLTVKDSWKDSYTAIPVLLDSAISNVNDGLAYLLDNAGTQSSIGTMIVGDGEEADISSSDVQKAISVLDSIQKGLRGTITVEIFGESVQVNAKKFFAITDGFQKYLPYHKIMDAETWNLASNSKYIFWMGKEDYTESELDNDYMPLAYAAIENSFLSDDSILYANISYGGYRLTYETRSDYYRLYLKWNGCEVSFYKSLDLDSDESASTGNPAYTIDSAYCKVENGTTQLKIGIFYAFPDIFHFTDANGNETVSATDFFNEEDHTVKYLEENIFFPDPTFNGIFPALDQHSLSVLLARFR